MAGTDPAGALLRLSAYRFAESGRPNRQQHTVGDAAWALADSAHLGIPTARVHLDHLRLYADRYAVTSEAAKKSMGRCPERTRGLRCANRATPSRERGRVHGRRGRPQERHVLRILR